MVRKVYTLEQIINKLGEVEVLISQGAPTVGTSRKAGIIEQTYYRWRREYGGMKIEQDKCLKALEKENSRLKRLVVNIIELD